MELSSPGLASCGSHLSKQVEKCLWAQGDGPGTLAPCIPLLKASRGWDGDLDVRQAIPLLPHSGIPLPHANTQAAVLNGCGPGQSHVEWHGTTAALPRGFRAIRTKGDIFPPKMRVPFVKVDHPLPHRMALPAPLHWLPANRDLTGSPQSWSTGRGQEKPCSTPFPCPRGRWGLVPGSLVYDFGWEPHWDILEAP